MSSYLDHHGFRRGKPQASRTEGPPCSECGKAMLVGQRGKHSACDIVTITGRRCSCVPGCTVAVVGDQGCCDPECFPCRSKRGQDHRSVAEWK